MRAELEKRMGGVKSPGRFLRQELALCGIFITVSVLFQLASPLKAATLENFRLRNFQAGGNFLLMDQDGREVNLASFRNRAVVMAFGFTHCPDICPTTALKMKRVLALLGDQADRTRMVFVSVDPERDTPAVLKNYLGFFHKDIIGLTGALVAIEEVAERYHAPFSKEQGLSQAGYLVSHVGLYYLLDKQGKVIYLLPHETTAEMLVEGLQTLIKN